MALDLEDKPGHQNDGIKNIPAGEGAHDDLGVSPDDKQKEIEDLENSFAAPSADKSDSVPAESLKEAEDNPDESLGKGYREEKKSIRSRVITRKKAAGGGIIGLIVGGSLFLASISSGPLQFIHISQLLQRFHFASAQDTGDSRILKLYKFAKNAKGGTVENTRLGIVGNKVALSLDTKLKGIGIEKSYNSLGTYDGTKINLDEFAASAKNGEQLKSLKGQDAVDWFKENYKVNVSVLDDGTLITKDDGFLNYFKNRRVNTMLAEESGYGKISGSLVARIMGKRDAATFHPIKSLDSKIVGSFDQKLTAWLDELKSRIKNGESKSVSAIADAPADANGNPDKTAGAQNEKGASDTNAVSQSADDVIAQSEDDIARGAKPAASDAGSGLIKQFTESTGGKVTLGATAVIGLACAAKGLSDSADALKHDLVVLPLIRMGVQAVSLGNQVMSGQDISAEQLGFFSRLLTDSSGASWSAARSIQAELGQPLTGPDLPETASIAKIQEGNMFSQLFGSIPGLDTVCDAVNSTAGNVVLTVVGLFTGPVGTIGGAILAESGALDGLIGNLVRWIAGSPIPTVVFGPEYGNFINYGARLAANDSFAASGGIPLSTLQANALKQNRIEGQKQEFANQSIAERVLDPYSPDSVLSKAIDKASPSVTTNIGNIFSSLINPAKVLTEGFGSVFTQHSLASPVNYDYGFPEIGFSLNDLTSSTYDDPYANAKSVMKAISGPNGNKLIDRANYCFGVKLDVTGSVTSSLSSLDVTKKDFYKSSDPSKNCTDQSEMWTRIRFYILDTKTAEAADCFNSGDAQSCSDTGFGSSSQTTSTVATQASSQIVGNPYESSVNVACATGTTDLGVHDAYADGNLVKMRLCALPNIKSSGEESNSGTWGIAGANGNAIVNSRVSGAWFALVNDAKSAGINLGANSTFRTMEHQKQLWDGAGHDSSRVARPGYSSHQAGVAIDFSNMGPYHASSGASCSNRQTRPGNSAWEWLYNHSYTYGFKQYAAEAWHWDALPMANRCGPVIDQNNPTAGPVRRF